MRKRNIQKIVRFNRKEAQDLAAKAKKACVFFFLVLKQEKIRQRYFDVD